MIRSCLAIGHMEMCHKTIAHELYFQPQDAYTYWIWILLLLLFCYAGIKLEKHKHKFFTDLCM